MFSFFKVRGYFILITIIIISLTSIYWLKGHSSPQLFGKAFFSVNTKQKVIALTFDDGPSILFTGPILDILKKHNIKATFFILGQNGEKNPELVKRIYKEGHELGNHSWSHKRLIFKFPSVIREEIERTDKLIRELGYINTIHFRAPYGNKLIALPWILKNMGRPHILFDIIPQDWELPSPEIITIRILEKLHPGGIILLHDAAGVENNEQRLNTVQALEIFIPQVKAKGYTFLTISQLIEIEEKD